MLTPGPDHPITITPAANRWQVLHDGHVIADTRDALVLKEGRYPAVIYFPAADVQMGYLGRTDRVTHCPYKGDASYYTVTRDGHIHENAVWVYEEPYPAMDQIAGRLAFYPEHFEIYELDDAADPHSPRTDIDAVVQHTDSGGGTSQREHWAPTAPNPDGGVV